MQNKLLATDTSTSSGRPGEVFNRSRCLRDEAGTPIVAYRGEHGASSTLIHSRTPYSVTFGSRDAAKAYALNPNALDDIVVEPRLIAAHLRIDRPAFNSPDDPFVDVTVLTDLLGRANAERIAVKLAKHIYNTNNWLEMADEFDSVEHLLATAPERFNDLYLDAYPILDDEECVAMFKATGFDGAIHMGNGATFGEVEYRVFDTAQILPIAVTCASTNRPLDKFMRFNSDLAAEVEGAEDEQEEACSPAP